MPEFTTHIPIRFLTKISSQLLLHGVHLADVLREIGLSDEVTENENTLISLQQLDAALTIIYQKTQRQDWGVEVGRSIHLEDYIPYGLDMNQNRTLGQFLHWCVNLSDKTHPPCSLSYSYDGDDIVTKYVPLVEMSPRVMDFLFDSHAASCHNFFKYWLSATSEPYDIYVSKSNLDGYGDFFDPARVHLATQNLPCVSVRIPIHLTEIPRQHGSIAANTAATAQITSDLGSVSEWTKLMLRSTNGTQVTQEMLAQLKNISTKTFGRYLASEGTSFRTLANQIKHEKACEWLVSSDQSVGEIAAALGYASMSNFSAAFKKMSGLSPVAFRRLNTPK